MEVYLDMLILENLIMNYIILLVTSKFSKEQTSILRMLISSLIGALYCAIVFFPALRFFYTLLFKVCLSFILVIVAFSPQKPKQFMKVLSIFYVVSFVFGGAAFGLFYFTNFGVILSNGVFYISNFPIKILIISTIISYLIIKFAWTTIQNKLSRDNMYVILDIIFEEKEVKLKGLIDTANSLYDPISNYPVIVVEFSAVKSLLPDEIKEIFSKCRENDLSLITSVLSNSDWISRFRLIPFSSLGKENGMLIGFRPDNVKVSQIESKKELKNIIIGVYNRSLSKDKSYNALLHSEIINL